MISLTTEMRDTQNYIPHQLLWSILIDISGIYKKVCPTKPQMG